MILKFLIVCKDCMQKYRTWEDSTLCNVHHEQNGQVILSCFKCGLEEDFKPDQAKKPNKKTLLLHREKMIIEEEIARSQPN